MNPRHISHILIRLCVCACVYFIPFFGNEQGTVAFKRENRKKCNVVGKREERHKKKQQQQRGNTARVVEIPRSLNTEQYAAKGKQSIQKSMIFYIRIDTCAYCLMRR